MKPRGARRNDRFRKPFLLSFAENPKGFFSTLHAAWDVSPPSTTADYHRCKQQLQPPHVPRSPPTKPFVTGVPINVAGHHRRRRRCCSGIIILLPSRGMRETQQPHRRKPSPAMSVAVRASIGVTRTSHAWR